MHHVGRYDGYVSPLVAVYTGADVKNAAALQAYPNFGGQVVMHMIRRVGPGIMQPIQIRGMNREMLVQLDRHGTDRVL